MARSRRADAVVFGFDFQVNSAIVLFLENIKEVEKLRLDIVNNVNFLSKF